MPARVPAGVSRPKRSKDSWSVRPEWQLAQAAPQPSSMVRQSAAWLGAPSASSKLTAIPFLPPSTTWLRYE